MKTQSTKHRVDSKMIMRALKDSFTKLAPKTQLENPVMFLVYVSAILTTGLFGLALLGIQDAPTGFIFGIALILWFTVLFANFAEAIAEGRGKAQADALRSAKKDVDAYRMTSIEDKNHLTVVSSASLKKGDLVLVKAGVQIPADGEVVEGASSVDESAITGESAPVIREAGGDRSAVTGGTTVISDWIVIQITSEAGESFLDKMIAMVEGAARKKTPNEIALQIFLVALTIIFILVTGSLYTYSDFSAKQAGIDNPTSITALIALLVCLAPTTIGALLSAIGIAGMSRLNQANVLAMSGRAIEAAGDVDILMLDKTGTITLGNRQASEFIPVDGHCVEELADAAQLSSLPDETPEGRSVVILAKERFGIRERNLSELRAEFVPFSAKTRMSGVNLKGIEVRKGAADSIKQYVEAQGSIYSRQCDEVVTQIANQGGTPLVVSKNYEILGVIFLKDIIKKGVKEKFADLRKMGIKTIMITGDNPLTAAAIAAEAGVDDFLAEATPEGKLAMIRDFQVKGHLVAMTGDGTNDAPALAQADVAVAMNTGTQAAKEAGNMVDLDSSPTKLIEIVRIGKQLLMTRGSLTTFSIANDLAKYFAIIPALFMGLYPGLSALNIMGLHSGESAIFSAIIYNALVIIALIPLALKGVKYREVSAGRLLGRNLLVYGVGGMITPFIFIKLIDMLIVALGIVA
ncbi:MAG: potassium-transporting ATPase subunit KdpB [Niameybacter sp.]